MKRTKKIFVAGALVFGMTSGALLFTPQGSNASGNVVLASVEWVTLQLNPMKSKMADFEKKLASQQQELNALRAQVNAIPTNPPTQAQVQLPASVTTNKKASVRAEASISSKVLSIKAVGTSLKVIDSATFPTGVWYHVVLSTTVKGWIAATDVSAAASASNATASSQASETFKQVVTKKIVTLRKGATDTYPVIGTLQSGITVKYVQSFINSKGETWLNVETATHVRGWMLSSDGEVK